jgi:hypothetical protein
MVLLTRDRAATGAAVLQTDKETDMWGIIQRARNYGANEGSHPLVLLALLFQEHVLETNTKFAELTQQIQTVDKNLLAELAAANSKNSKHKVSEYGDLSHRIYQARMGVVELQRRREFEAQVGNTLQEDSKDDPYLLTLVETFAGLSDSFELNIQSSFPDRIEGQRTVL